VFSAGSNFDDVKDRWKFIQMVAKISRGSQKGRLTIFISAVSGNAK
jgi:hypothetical protein